MMNVERTFQLREGAAPHKSGLHRSRPRPSSSISVNSITRTRRIEFRAFTLIEMILAIGVCSIVLLAINGAFFGALRLRNHTTDVVDAALPVQQAVTFLKRDLQSALPPGGVMAGDFKAGAVSSLGTGEGVSLEFSTSTGALRESEVFGDVQRVTYGLRHRPGNVGGQDLIRTVTRNLLATITPIPGEQPLLSNVESLQVSCFDGSQWLDTWDTSLVNTNLPVAVRVRILQASETRQSSRDAQPIEIIVPISAQLRGDQVLTEATEEAL